VTIWGALGSGRKIENRGTGGTMRGKEKEKEGDVWEVPLCDRGNRGEGADECKKAQKGV